MILHSCVVEFPGEVPMHSRQVPELQSLLLLKRLRLVATGRRLQIPIEDDHSFRLMAITYSD